MNLSMAGALAAGYHSGAQRARVVTEAWGAENLYCPNCSSPKLGRLSHNTKASDFCCPSCRFWYQLKSQKSRIGDSITDGAYAAMMNAICCDEMPSMYFMQYDLATWSVRNLLLIPHFAFPPSAIIKRKPLAPTARRHGWVGCNFALNRIPADARIFIVRTERSTTVPVAQTFLSAGSGDFPVAGPKDRTGMSVEPAGSKACPTLIIPPEEVRERFKRVKPLKEIGVKERGWTLDVLNAIGRLGKSQFTTSDAYDFTRELEKLHPDNRHVRDKIRQQLQVLRDAGLLLHVERGLWQLP